MRYPNELFERGACLGSDTDAFYPLTTSLTTENKLAKRICNTRCEVVDECLQWALTHERHGIWGGTTSTERQVLRQRLGLLLDERALRAS